MKVFRAYQNLPVGLRGSVLAIGNFDGLHLGHQAVLATARAQAEKLSAPLTVMTFEPHPRRFFNPAIPRLRLMRPAEKLWALAEEGVSAVVAQRFDATFASLDADSFIVRVLVEHFGVCHVVTGEGFVFGKGRGGDSAVLREGATRHGFGYSTLPPVTVGGVPCSSTCIRDALSRGDAEKAASLLGRPHSISGRVGHGDARGRGIGFPTANLSLAGLFLPRFGVYAIEAERSDGTMHQGVANLGQRPTVGGESILAEAHLFDFAGDLYGERLRISLRHFLRSERHFDGLDSLKAQIARDADETRRYFRICDAADSGS